MSFQDKKRAATITSVAVFLIIFDRFFKILSLSGYLNKPLSLIGDYFKLSFSKNYHIAFSLPLNNKFATFIITIIIVLLLYYFLFNFFNNKLINSSLLPLIILGASSNLFDRLKCGFVIDYLDLKYFTVFNLADIMIVAGVIGLLVFINKKQTT